MKTEWDTAGQGVHVVAGAEDADDIIPANRWLKREDVPGRISEMMKPMPRIGRRPRLGHEPAGVEPLRFYVPIKDAEDIGMLVIPKAFQPVMKRWLVVSLPCVVKLSTNKWYEFWVQVKVFQEKIVLARGWDYFCRKHKIVPGDLLILKLSNLGFKVEIYNAANSTICRYRCAKHVCQGDMARAI